MIIISNHHTKACAEAWINCENLLNTVCEAGNSLSKKFFSVIDECALICMSTFHALKTQSTNIGNLALLCVGICEECAELCESQTSEEFLACARVCRECSNKLSSIAYSSLQ
jgi:hypothetical protein